MSNLSKLIVVELLKDAKKNYRFHMSRLNKIHSKYQEAAKDHPHYAFSEVLKWSMDEALASEAQVKQVIHLNNFFVEGHFDKEIESIEDYDLFLSNFMKTAKDNWVDASRHYDPSSKNLEVFCDNYERYESIVHVATEDAKPLTSP
jgi:hypothetical protein